MKKFYLLLIALVCAVCANAEVKTAVFDFASNPWEHALGSGSGATAEAGNVDQLLADDNATLLIFNQGTASTPARMWTGPHLRCYNKSTVTVQPADGVITGIEVTATTGSYLWITNSGWETNDAVKTIEFEEGVESYEITIGGTTRWTKLVVTYEVEDGPAGEPTLSETNVTDLSTLGNKKAYALKAISGEGFFCYNPDVHATNVAICGVTDYSYQKSVGNAAWEAPFEVANANHQWQILTLDGKHYIYNLGAKKYMALNGSTYVFSETPAEMEIRTNAETESVDGHSELTLGGTFSIRAKGSGNLAYTCICTSRNNNPVATWSYNDHGGPMVITEIENVTDGTAIEALEELVAQQERTAEWNELLAAAKAEYNGNNKFSEGANIITDAGWFSSNATESKEGDITKLIDGKCDTFWHSSWSATNGAAVAFHLHYLQVSLPEAIEGLTQLTMGRRINGNNFCDDNPVEMSVTFSATGDDNDFSEPVYFDTPFNQTIANPYVKATFEVPAGTKYLRFYNEKSNGSLQRGYWHCGEFQLNPVVLDPTCVNAQYPTESYLFTETLAEADAVDAATVTAEQIAALKEAQAAYHFATYTYNAAELNTLAADVQAKVGEVEVVYVNGQYNYIKDESGITLLFDQNKTLTLTAGDKVQGLIVVGSPYNGLPEVKPLTAMDDLTVTPNAEYTFAPAEATAAPTATGANQIWKYTGVKATADHTFATNKATNLVGTWQENDLTFRNAFKHLTTEFKEGKFYSIVGATAVYNNDVQVYVISAEEEASKVEVTYNVTFNGETLKSQTIGETVGQAPTFTLDAPAYVSVSGMPETIEEGVTEVTVETALNEQAPFDMENEYILNFTYTNAQGTYTYWFNDNESGKLNELRAKEDGVTIESLDESSRWTMGGDWLNGFTLQNVKTGNYVAAGDNYNNGTNVKVGETAEKYELVKYSAGWRLKVNNTFLAHYSANNHIVSYHNPETYAASYVTFIKYVAPAPIEPVETKTVTITFVTSAGDKYMFNNNEGTLELIEYTAEAPKTAQFESTLWSNEKYTYTNGGKYLGFNRLDDEFTAALNYWSEISFSTVEKSQYVTEDAPEGSVYLQVQKRSAENSSVGVFVMKVADHSFNAATAPFFTTDYTSVIFVDEYVAPAPENPFTLDYDGNETITITPKDPEATYFWGIANDAIMGLTSYTNVYDFYDYYLCDGFWEEDMCTGVSTMTDTYYRSTWQYGLTEGLNYILVANGYWDPHAEVCAVRTGEIYVFEITTGVPTGVGTVLRQEADSKAIFNLQGQHLGKIQKGINIVNGKKILK